MVLFKSGVWNKPVMESRPQMSSVSVSVNGEMPKECMLKSWAEITYFSYFSGILFYLFIFYNKSVNQGQLEHVISAQTTTGLHKHFLIPQDIK